MEAKKTKWLIYTVLVGLIPIICRFLVWVISEKGSIDIISPADLIVFGLVLHISNINELENLNDLNSNIKTIYNGLSIAFISFYSVLFTFTLIAMKSISLVSLKNCCMILALTSFFISFSIYFSKKNSLNAIEV